MKTQPFQNGRVFLFAQTHLKNKILRKPLSVLTFHYSPLTTHQLGISFGNTLLNKQT
jgi:hypothetical protein